MWACVDMRAMHRDTHKYTQWGVKLIRHGAGREDVFLLGHNHALPPGRVCECVSLNLNANTPTLSHVHTHTHSCLVLQSWIYGSTQKNLRTAAQNKQTLLKIKKKIFPSKLGCSDICFGQSAVAFAELQRTEGINKVDFKFHRQQPKIYMRQRFQWRCSIFVALEH